MGARRISWRVRGLIFGTVLVLSIFAGWLISRTVDSSNAGSDGAVATLPAVGVTVHEPGLNTNPDLANKLLPDLTIHDLSGNAVRLRSLSGHPMVINLWYASCPPCKAEMPAFVNVHAQLGDTVRFVGLNTQDSAVETRKFADSVGVHYELYTDQSSSVADALQLSNFPTTLFVAADGHITSIQSGALTEATLTARIHKELVP